MARTRGGRSGSTSEFDSATGAAPESSAPEAEVSSAPRPRGGANLGMEYLQMARKQSAAGTFDTRNTSAKLKPVMGGPDGNIPMDPRNPTEPLPQDRRHPKWKNVVGEGVPSKPMTAASIINRARSVAEVRPYQSPEGPRMETGAYFTDQRVENARARKEKEQNDLVSKNPKGFTGQPTALNAGLSRARTLSETPGRKRMVPKADLVTAIQGHRATLLGYLNRYSNIRFLSTENAKAVSTATASLAKVKSALALHADAERRGATAIGSKHLWTAAAHLHSAQTHLDQPSISEVTKDRPAWEVPLVRGGTTSDYGLTTEHVLVAAREHYNVKADPKKNEFGTATPPPEGDKPLTSDTSPEADYAREVRSQTTNTYSADNNPSTVGKIDPTSIFSEDGSRGGKPIGSKTDLPGPGAAAKQERESRIKSAPQAPKQAGKTILGVPLDAAAKAKEINAAQAKTQRETAAGSNKKAEDVIPASVRKEGRKSIKSDRQAVIDALTAKNDEIIARGQTATGAKAEPTEDYVSPEAREKAASSKAAAKPKKVNPFDELLGNIVAARNENK